MSSPRIWGPVILQAADSLVRHQIRAVDRSLVETYWDIVSAASHQHVLESFTEREDARLDQTAYELSQIVRQGWLNGDIIDVPQGVFTESRQLKATSVENPADSLYGDKPEGALWTSSYLPDGSSAWARGEASEFPGWRRPLRNFTCDPLPPGAIYRIGSPADYGELVTAYPRQVDRGHVAVDWPRVADDYVAVRLTAAGLALAQHYRVLTPVGAARLTGWDAESTAWLRVPRGASLSD